MRDSLVPARTVSLVREDGVRALDARSRILLIVELSTTHRFGTRMLAGTLPQQVTELLRERILSGVYAPGARIVEAELAGELDVSRHTLRSALQILTFEVLLVQDQFKNTHVPLPRSEDVFETYTLRNALEAMACRLAAERAAAFGTADLDATVGRRRAATKAKDRAAMVSADYDFHVAVVDLAGHARLREHYRLLQARTRLPDCQRGLRTS